MPACRNTASGRYEKTPQAVSPAVSRLNTCRDKLKPESGCVQVRQKIRHDDFEMKYEGEDRSSPFSKRGIKGDLPISFIYNPGARLAAEVLRHFFVCIHSIK